jgi:predicted Rossmann-fold nucleotide-binding protein
MIKIICAYAGSSDKMDSEYLEAARQMGHSIARRGISLAYGAGSTGVMGALADGALEASGR